MKGSTGSRFEMSLLVRGKLSRWRRVCRARCLMPWRGTSGGRGLPVCWRGTSPAMVHRTRTIGSLWWCGALSVVQAHCSSDTKQSAYKVAAAFAAAKAKLRAVGRRGGGSRAEGGTVGGDGLATSERESQRYQRVGIVYRANQNQPFQQTSLPLSLSSPHAFPCEHAHTWPRVYTRGAARRVSALGSR